jgi:hypothetical protein
LADVSSISPNQMITTSPQAVFSADRCDLAQCLERLAVNAKVATVDRVAGVLGDHSNPAKRDSHTGPPVYIGWNRVHPMQPGGPVYGYSAERT